MQNTSKKQKKADINQLSLNFERIIFYYWPLINLSASNAAIHPVPAEVIAWR